MLTIPYSGWWAVTGLFEEEKLFYAGSVRPFRKPVHLTQQFGDKKEGGQLGPCISWDESMKMAVQMQKRGQFEEPLKAESAGVSDWMWEEDGLGSWFRQSIKPCAMPF